MLNLMREHVPQETRIHYVITRGGNAPNVVPDFAEVYVYARHPDMKTLREIWGRIVKASEGAALGTGTTVDHEVIAGVFNKLPNETLARIVDRNLRRVGGYALTPEERVFAERVQATLSHRPPLDSTREVRAFRTGFVTPASTDVGDVSWNVPVAELGTATWVPGTPAHSWQAVAAGGSSIGTQGMMVAAKTLALSAIELIRDPAAIQAAKAELITRRGAGFVYRALLGDRKPALDYRR
jgi:aminobenzoyl-glutamate utilization protein B